MKNLRTMKIVIIATLLFFSFQLFSQDWNPLTHNPDVPGLEDNPFKGFSTMWDPSNNFPYSIQGELFGLKDVMNGIDDFDWTPVENFLAEEAALGNHCSLQFNIDPGIGETDLMSEGLGISLIPDYLVDLVEWEYYETTPEEFAETGIPYYNCPDWNDPDLMEAMLNFIEAFGDKYDGDDRVFIVQLGLYGMWGEWHIGDVENVNPGFAMTAENEQLIVDAFKENFTESKLVARFPADMPDPEEFGYSDGLFFTESISDDFPWYFHNTLMEFNADQNWKRHPIGGEITPQVQATIWDNWPNTVGQDAVETLNAIHPTWLFSHFVLTDLVEGSDAWNNALTIQKMMGYSFFVDKYKLTAEEGKPAVEVNIQNLGLAPIYANWDVELGVIDENDQFQLIGTANWNLDLIQPEVTENHRSFLSDQTLVDGTYEFVMRVVNPLWQYSPENDESNAPDLTFANVTQDASLEGWLTLGSGTIVEGQLGQLPVPVSGFSITPLCALITVNESLQLTGTVLPVDASNQEITWVSDHPSICSVDENGVITGAGAGTCKIYAYTNDGALEAESFIVVEAYAHPVPGLIEAEDFIEMSGIDVEPSDEGGDNIGGTDGGDYMLYNVNVSEAGYFEVDYRVASPAGVGQFELLAENDEIIHGMIETPETDGWQVYTTATSEVIFLPAGTYQLKFNILFGAFNINWLEFRSVEDPNAILGCTDPSFIEFDPLADTDDGSCLTSRVYGCVYATAANYNPAANTDDLSCVFGEGCVGDLNNDAIINAADLLAFLGVFGSFCE